ncbi:MAG: flippase-like domain-containing protein [Bacilli bacterium]|nr:flippase-like domain-containing protein [Bacilli bacterium]
MQNNKRNFIIILALASIVIFFSLKNDYKSIIKAFSSINMLWLMAGVFMNIVIYHLADSLFIYYYCHQFKKDYSLMDAIKVEQAGVFFSAITPSSSGGQFAQILVFQKQNISTSRSASMLMLSFISWQTVLVFFGLLVLVFNYNGMLSHFNIGFSVVIIGFLVNFIVIVGLFLSAFSKKFHDFILNKLIPFLGKFRLFKKLKDNQNKTKVWLQLFRDEFQVMLSHPKLMLYRLGTDLFKIIVLYTAPFLAAKAIGVNIGFDKIIFILIMSTFMYMITSIIPIPGGAGGSEGTFVLLMNLIFASATTSVMLMWRILTYYLPMLISFGVFANIKELRKDD